MHVAVPQCMLGMSVVLVHDSCLGAHSQRCPSPTSLSHDIELDLQGRCSYPASVASKLWTCTRLMGSPYCQESGVRGVATDNE